MRHAALWAACLVSADRAQRRRLRPVLLRAVVLRPPLDLAEPPPIDPPPPIGDGGVGGVPEGCGAGQIDPGCFCADQSVPVFSSCMRPPQISFALGEVLTCDVSYRVRHRAARPYSY